ncbi:MAG: glycosyltransferase family 9 protein [Desulfovibrio sp.]|nr:glycosyltransferase family 9 protein [Desulfovibrio sp.]
MGERGSRLLHALDYYAGVPLSLLSALPRLPGRSLARRGMRPPEESACRKIGFLSLGAIGDLLLLSALITALRKKLPHARFTLFTSMANAQAIPLLPGIDNHASLPLRQLPGLLSAMRKEKLDILFDSTQWARLGTILSNLSGASVTVGFETEGQKRGAGYTWTVHHGNACHETENFLRLGRVLYPDLSGKPELCPPINRPQNPLCLEITETKRPAILHMWPSGISSYRKEWPAPYWADLIARLEKKGYTVFLSGGKGDREKTEAFLSSNRALHARSMAGAFSLTDLAWVFGRTSLVVSVNTGIMHLAALCNVPTVALNGPTNPKRWGPVGKKVRSLLPKGGRYAYLDLGFEYGETDDFCMQYLSVEDVLSAVEDMEENGGDFGGIPEAEARA